MNANRVQIERILCPTDFSEISSRALQHAIALASRFEAQLSLVHVVPSAVSPTGGAYFPATREMRRQAGEELRGFAALAVQALVRVETDLREGEPWREIQAAAEQLPADLVVMGTHGRGGFENLLLGSVAERVMRRAPCPVLTVGEAAPEGAPGMFGRILCAADLSESSASTVAFALSLAAEHQAELTLLHVLEGLHLYEDAPELLPLRRNLEEVARGQLAAAVPPDAREWCTVHELVTLGRAHREILRVAVEKQADLIVMGTHGHGPMGRMLFGSTSNSVVRAAHCPVLTVRQVRKATPAGAQASRAGVQDLQPKP